MWLSAILISSSVKCLFILFVHFLIGLFIFLMLSFENSFYILDTSPLSEMFFPNIFSQYIACFLAFFFFLKLIN